VWAGARPEPWREGFEVAGAVVHPTLERKWRDVRAELDFVLRGIAVVTSLSFSLAATIMMWTEIAARCSFPILVTQDMTARNYLKSCTNLISRACGSHLLIRF
jgi:hypothetical protein